MKTKQKYCIEFPNVQESDTTGADSCNAAK
jgi:hypothetical protein